MARRFIHIQLTTDGGRANLRCCCKTSCCLQRISFKLNEKVQSDPNFSITWCYLSSLRRLWRGIKTWKKARESATINTPFISLFLKVGATQNKCTERESLCVWEREMRESEKDYRLLGYHIHGGNNQVTKRAQRQYKPPRRWLLSLFKDILETHLERVIYM